MSALTDVVVVVVAEALTRTPHRVAVATTMTSIAVEIRGNDGAL